MKPALLFLLVAALGNCCYHLGQKSLHIGGNPMLLLALYYTFALALALAAAPFFGAVRFQTASSAPWPIRACGWCRWAPS